ncbi:MAG: InlB B-repeat-containing protein, partial [Defluviitaleaceae bacterium]|nr:InlB B-repeat-containing protein [Defluviitaleaceae bacterium]
MKLSNRARFAVAFIFAIVLVGSAVFAISNAYDDWDYDYANMYDLYAVITIPHGQAIQYIPETPQIPGYRFVHWSATPDGEAFDFDAQIYDEVTLYAVWASQEDYAYSPGYDGYEYGGYINYAPRYYSYDYVGYAPYYEPYTHEAYCYGSYYSYYLGYQGTLEIRFLWNRYHLSAYSYAANSFMVTFVANGGLIRPGNFTRRSDPVTDTVTPQDMPLIPTRGGFAFSQWNTEPDGSGLAFTGNTVMTGNITVYAQWGRSIRFHGNGVSLAVLPPDQNDPTSYIERVIPMARSVANTDGIAWPNDPTRIGWVFVGWYDTVELLGGTAFTAYSVITHNVYLFARWELAPLITVTFDPTLGEITPAFLADHGNVRWHVAGLNVNQTNSALLAANVPNPNTTNNFPTVEAPPGSGLIFVGWANAARTVMVSPFNTGQTVEAPPHAGIGLGANILTESITLYAVWAFQIAGLGAATGAGLSDGTPVNQIPNRVWVTSLGQALTIYQAGHTMGNISRPMRPDPVRSGMQFQYWRITAPASMYGQAFTQHTPVASNMTVQPVWTSNSLIAVTLDANGGIFTNGSPTFTVTLPSGSYGYRYTTQPLVGSATVTPEKAGHIFAGFYCTEGYLRAMEGDTRPIVADKTLTARWIPMVTLTFITDEATTPAENSVTRNSPQGYNIRTIQEIMWFIHDGRTFAPEQSVPGNPPG